MSSVGAGKVLVSIAVATALALAARAASWSYSESGNVELPDVSEATTLTIASGVSITNTTALTGAGLLTVTGGGALRLAAASPDFSGGFYIQKATVAPMVSGALGTGAVRILGYSGTGTKTSNRTASRVFFENGSVAATFANDFFVETADDTNEEKSALVIGGTGKVTVDGSIETDSGVSLHIVGCVTGSSIEVLDHIEVGTLACMGSAAVNDNKLVTVDLRGAVKANAVSANGSSGWYKTAVTFHSANNEIGTISGSRASTVAFTAENAAGGARLNFQNMSTTEKVNGYSQIIGSLSSTAGSSLDGGSDDMAVVTMTGGVATATSTTTFKGKLALVIDDTGAAGDFEQVQNGGAHTMSGTMTVKRGTYKITGAATYKNVPSVSVEGGVLDVETTAANPFSGVTSLSVGAAGKLKVASGVAFPFPNNRTLDVSFTKGAAYEGDDVEIMAKSLTIDGVLMAKGVWTHEDNDAIPEGITVSMVSKEIELTESGEIDFAGTYGAVEGFWQVTVASGVTITNTTALVGGEGEVMRIIGGGTFVQQAASPDFASEIRIGKASVAVAADTALGSALVVIDGYTKAKGKSQLFLDRDAAAISFPNDVCILSSGGDSLDNCQLAFSGGSTGHLKATLSGDISCEDAALYVYAGLGASKSTAADFEGDITAASFTLCRGTYHFYGTLTIAGLFYTYGNANTGDVRIETYSYLHSSDNRIGSCSMRINSRVGVMAENALGGARLAVGNVGYNIYSNDQTVAFLTGTGTGAVYNETGDAATLTLTGGVAVATALTTLEGKMNLVVDDCGAEGDFVQVSTNAVHTMSGTIAVRRGALRLSGSTTFKSVSGVEVSGGSLALETEGATFGTAAQVATRKLTMTIAPSSSVSIADGLTVNVNRLWVGEEGQKAGDYTGEGGPSTATVLPQLTGTGVLHVGRSSGQGMILLFR